MIRATSRAAFVLTLAALTPPGASAAGPQEEGEGRVFVGYLYGRPKDIHFSLYTHLCHAFVTADADGKVRPEEGVPSRDLADRAHEAGVKVLLSLGGWGWDKQFAAITAAKEAEDRYVRSIIGMVESADYDGVDLDWEYPDTADEVAGFERLTRRLRADLDAIGTRKGRRMTLTMAASSNPGTLRWLGKDFLLETMDWVNVMTYDMAGPWTSYAGHNAPLLGSSKVPGGRGPSAEATVKYLMGERGLPASRLALGIPLYGRGFAVAAPYAPTKGAPKARFPEANYRDLHKLLADGGWTRLWDAETSTPWLVATDRSAVIGYDDAESVALKTAWARKIGLRGVFFWEIAADRLPDGSNPLQEASRKEWDKGPARSPR